MNKEFLSKKNLVLVISFVLVVLLGFFFLFNSNRVQELVEEGPAVNKITGAIYVYRVDDGVLTVKLEAKSDAGEIKEVLVWTDSNPDAEWQQMKEFISLPVSDSVYAQFRDEFGNLSEIYSDTIYPPQGPPDAPGY